MTVVLPRAYGMLGTVTRWLYQLDRVTACCDNAGVGCAIPYFANPPTMGSLTCTARLVGAFHCSQAGSIDATKG